MTPELPTTNAANRSCANNKLQSLLWTDKAFQRLNTLPIVPRLHEGTWNGAVVPPTSLVPFAATFAWPALDLSYPKLPGLKSLRLWRTRATERNVATLVQACPNLEELSVEFIGSYLDAPMSENDFRDRTRDIPLSEALQAVSGTLRSLSITSCGHAHYLERQSRGGGRPEDHRILTLHQLPKLKHLGIDLFSLFGNIPHLNASHASLFAARIPPWVESLTLFADWDGYTSPSFIGLSVAINLFEFRIIENGITELLKDKNRHLSELRIVYPPIPADAVAEHLFNQSVDRLEAVALEAGVVRFEAAVSSAGFGGDSHARNAADHGPIAHWHIGNGNNDTPDVSYAIFVHNGFRGNYLQSVLLNYRQKLACLANLASLDIASHEAFAAGTESRGGAWLPNRL
ncbi:uncharacterized protein DNG_08192 [Cephalotrichum gorgonifer]|uniref:F-box domain-containing protein n=1 Tax=Cephalotrichum gorgonifer TaxID=2041049 RepID=A0AAE8SY43_9PEZI|nr:uncharacterized protein DNG_08192 [Cephalotrichum gorgonifer]